MAKEKPLDFLLLGPANPYRGGIADTQHALAENLISQGYTIKMWTFTQLYPSLLFPGKTQFTEEKKKYSILAERRVHAYNPLKWKSIIKAINQLQPKVVVFRYWTPFLSPCWSNIAKGLNKSIKKIGWVDNWKAHEPKPWDNILTRRFEKAMDFFTTLSPAISDQIKQDSSKKVWGKMHPIEDNLPKKTPQLKAQEQLHLNKEKKIILFFGLIRAYKGLSLLLQVVKNQPKLHLLIVGESYENWGKYNQLIQKYHIEKQITRVNRFVNQDEASLYFSAAEATVLPYTSATQSGVLSLAYHYETPLIVTDHPGLRQPIDEDHTGIVCKQTVDGLNEAILNVIEPIANQNFRKNLNQTKSRYSWATYAQEWTNFIFNETS